MSPRNVGNALAGPGEIFVCGACGKTSRRKYGFDEDGHHRDEDGRRYASPGWDASCMSNSVLVFESSIKRDGSGRIVEATAVPEIAEVECEVKVV